MKNKMMNLGFGAVIAAGLAVSPSAFAYDSALLAKQTALVANASASDKQSVAVSVVKSVIGADAAAATEIVWVLARDNSNIAATIASTAATLQPKQIAAIAKAAVTAAPSEAGKIVAALIKVSPKDYSAIAIAAAQAAPSAGRDIIAAVAANVPSMQSSIQNAIAGFAANDNFLPVQSILSAPAGTVASIPQPTPSVAPMLSPVGSGVTGPLSPSTGTITVLTSGTAEGSGPRNYGVN